MMFAVIKLHYLENHFSVGIQENNENNLLFSDKFISFKLCLLKEKGYDDIKCSIINDRWMI